MGADDYLKKVKEKQENLLKGERLLGLESEVVDPPPSEAQAPVIGHTCCSSIVAGTDNLTIKCVDIIDDIKLDGQLKVGTLNLKKLGKMI